MYQNVGLASYRPKKAPIFPLGASVMAIGDSITNYNNDDNVYNYTRGEFIQALTDNPSFKWDVFDTYLSPMSLRTSLVATGSWWNADRGKLDCCF
jgi:hypothetical protein